MKTKLNSKEKERKKNETKTRGKSAEKNEIFYELMMFTCNSKTTIEFFFFFIILLGRESGYIISFYNRQWEMEDRFVDLILTISTIRSVCAASRRFNSSFKCITWSFVE